MKIFYEQFDEFVTKKLKIYQFFYYYNLNFYYNVLYFLFKNFIFRLKWLLCQNKWNKMLFFLVQGTKKRSIISLETKLKFIEDAESNNNSKLSRMYGLKRTTIIEILKAKGKIMQAVDDGYGTNRKNLKNAESPVLDQSLFEWFRHGSAIYSKKVRKIELESLNFFLL
jgi:hypothetical protein